LSPGRILPLAGLCLILATVGCGGSDQDATITAGPDHSRQISRLERQKRRLEKQVRAQEKKDAAAAAAKTAEVGGDFGVTRMLAALPGTSGLVVGAPGSGDPDLSGGGFATGDAWSTIKVPIVERVLADAGGPDGISSAQADQIGRAITLSDNDAAAALFAGLEQRHGGLAGASEAVGEMLRQAGDDETVISTRGRDGFSTYGQTDWSLAAQYRYMAALAGGCISDPASRAYLLARMGEVGGSDLYGLGAAGFPARWKGGWGPGTDGRYLVRQFGVMEVNGKSVVVAMAAVPDDGTLEAGQSMLSNVARWIAAHLADRISTPSGC
jgi:hypothetical protein